MENGRLVSYSQSYGGGPLGQATTPFYRLASLVLTLPEIDPPVIDLSAGPLLDKNEFSEVIKAIQSGSSGLSSLNYPARAVRAEATGRETVECQVQKDRSIICHMASFDPIENAPYFKDAIAGIFRKVREDEKLVGGQPSVGARFQFPLSWRL